MVFSDLLGLCLRIVCFSLQQDVAISPKQRDEVIQWLAKLKYQFHLYPETLALAISLLDRFLAVVKVNICKYINRNRFLLPTQQFLCTVLLAWPYGNACFPSALTPSLDAACTATGASCWVIELAAQNEALLDAD